MLQGDFTLDSTSGLSTLDLSIPQPDGEAPSTIRITPGAFADGGAMVQLADGGKTLCSCWFVPCTAPTLSTLLTYLQQYFVA